MSRLALIAAALLLAACTMAPTYKRPDSSIQAFWPDDGQGKKEEPSTIAVPAADIGWRDFFSDPRLQKLVELALKNNRDLRVAALNIEQARAQYQIRAAALYPGVNATTTGAVQRQPLAVYLPSAGSGGLTIHNYNIGVGVTSYEVDLFGRIRSLKEQALQQFFGMEESRTTAQISLVAQVANAYLTWLADRELLKVAEETLVSQGQTYSIQERAFQGGVLSAQDFQQAATAVSQAKLIIAQNKLAVAQDMNLLVLLVGEPFSDEVQAYLAANHGLENDSLLEALPAGLPSDLLRRRPDIRSAEDNLIAANANIGAARAAFFPTLTLTGAFGTASSGLSGLFAGGSQAWNFTPQVSVPLFDGGVNLANLKAAKVNRDLYVAQYQKSIQTAFREVADALAARKSLDDQLKAQEEYLKATDDSYKLYDLRFRNGIDSDLNVLIWQRSLYTARQNLVSTRLARLQNLVNLYKALGEGG